MASKPPLFKWKHFQADIILQCIRWYLRYSLTYRDLVEMMAERGIDVSHTTIMRWVHQYGPELDKKIRKKLKMQLEIGYLMSITQIYIFIR